MHTNGRLHRYGGIWPITESTTGEPIEKVTVGGREWDLYFGYNGDMKVYSFLPPDDNPITDFSADVKDYFDYLTNSHDFPESNQYMLSKNSNYPMIPSYPATYTNKTEIVYQVGTEAFTGGPATFTVSQFSAEVN